MSTLSQLFFLLLITLISICNGNMVISGVIDGDLFGGEPKSVELYVVDDIPDLSLYGIGSANNGGGTDGQNIAFSGTATAGQYIYVTTDNTDFLSFFGFNADYQHGQASLINGDDAIELFFNGIVIDVFGEIDIDGTGEPWEYTDGWVYRKDCTGPDGTTFQLNNWEYSGVGALEDETTNDEAAIPFPIGTYQGGCTLSPTEEPTPQPPL